MTFAFQTCLSTGGESRDEAPLVPTDAAGRLQSGLAHAMAEHLRITRPSTGADALQELRSAFPNTTLSARVAVLAFMMRR